MDPLYITKPLPGATIDLQYPLSRGLVGCWLFNEGAGSRLADISGNGNHGTLTNMDVPGVWTGSPGGGALDFDGVDDFVSVGTHPSLTPKTVISVSVWFMSNSLRINEGVVSDWPGGGQENWAMWKDPSGFPGFIIRVSGATKAATSAELLDDSKWHHYVGFFDGSNVRLVIDGGKQNIVGDATSGPIDSDTSFIEFGRYSSSNGQAVNAAISNCRIYDRVLSLAESQELFNSPYPGISS